MMMNQWWAGPHLTRTTKIYVALAFHSNWKLILGLWVSKGKLLSLYLPSETTLNRSFHAFQYWSGSFNWLKNKWPSLACWALAVITKAVTLPSSQSLASLLPHIQPSEAGQKGKIVGKWEKEICLKSLSNCEVGIPTPLTALLWRLPVQKNIIFLYISGCQAI